MANYRIPVLEDFSWQPPVKDKDLSEQPGAGILKGDRYIVGASATGHWTGKEKDIATAKQIDPTEAAHWLFDTPVEGWQCWVDDEDVNYTYSGTAWAISPAGDNAASIDSLETVASAAISSIDSLEVIDSTNASTNVVQDASIDSLELIDSTNASADVVQNSSIDSLETVASAAISSIDSLELIDSTNASTNVVQDASIDSIETAKWDIGTYVTEYGAIEVTI